MNKNNLALLFFLLLFPGLFFYSSAVAAGMPAFIGGGFGVLATLAFALLFPAVLMSLPRLRGPALIVTLLFMTLMAYTTVWMVVHYLLSGHRHLGVVSQWLSLIVSWAALFSIGYFWPDHLRCRRTLALSFIAMVVMVMTNLDARHLIYTVGLSDAAGVLSYQGLGRSVAFTGVVLLAVLRDQSWVFLVSILLVITVFLTGARSELVGVVLALPMIFYYHLSDRPAKTAVTATIGFMAAVLVIVINYDSLLVSRQMQLFDIGESNSILTRIDLHAEAFRAILQNPVFGDFAGHYREHQDLGHYAHDVLSAWRQLGIVGFICYAVLLVLPPVAILYKITKQRELLRLDVVRIAGVLSLYTLILAIGAKSIFWAFPALSWGVFVSSLVQRRHVIRRAICSAREIAGVGCGQPSRESSRAW